METHLTMVLVVQTANGVAGASAVSTHYGAGGSGGGGDLNKNSIVQEVMKVRAAATRQQEQ